MWSDLLDNPTPENRSKLKITVASLVVILLLIPLGVYLVRQTQIFQPKAVDEEVPLSENSFSLNGLADTNSLTPGQEFSVEVLVRSDFDNTNSFTALLSYPANLLDVVGIEAPEATVSATGAICGGIAGLACPAGQVCQYHNVRSRADESGICINDSRACTSNDQCVQGQVCESGACKVGLDGFCQGGEVCATGLSCQTVVVGDTATMRCKRDGDCPQVMTRACRDRSTCNSSGACTDVAPECQDFPTPCDVPAGWYPDTGISNEEEGGVVEGESTSCAQVITRACSPTDPQICQAFSTPCDVPQGWIVVQAYTGPSFFVNQWSLKESNESSGTGVISLAGTTGGTIKTTPGNPLLLAKIKFKATQPGAGTIAFNESEMQRASDHVNILQTRRNLDFTIIGATPSPSASPSSSPSALPSGSPSSTPSSSPQTPICTTSANCGANQYCQLVESSGSPSGYCIGGDGSKGDANDDGFIDLIDLSIMYSSFFKNVPKLDLDNNGIINSLDYGRIIPILRALHVIK